jgi:integrase
LRDWEKAQATVRDWEAEGERQPPDAEPITIAAACDEFITDLRRRKVTEGTVGNYRLLFRTLQSYAADKGVRYLKELELLFLRSSCTTWAEAAQTQLKKLERLRAFLRFGVESQWIANNLAKRIKPPTVRRHPTVPFTQDEMVQILSACDRYPDCYGHTGQWNGKRLQSLVLLLRYSGLRIGDAVRLSRDRIVDNRLFLYTAKSGVPGYCPLPEYVADALNAVKSSNRQYYFWSGTSDRDGVARDYMRYLKKLFHLAGIRDGHSHRFRDTFAVELLLAGDPIERVSVLPGHSSTRVTEQNYAPWVRARQEQLEADVKRTRDRDPLAFAAMQGTREVHGKEKAVDQLKTQGSRWR